MSIASSLWANYRHKQVATAPAVRKPVRRCGCPCIMLPWAHEFTAHVTEMYMTWIYS